MSRKIVILGGYGVFGGQIASNLANRPVLADSFLVIAGRNPKRGKAFAHSIGATYAYCDLKEARSLHRTLANAYLVIHAAGPFYGEAHRVAKSCLEVGAHYLDIADNRSHVASISTLHDTAQQQALFLCSGASTTPAVTSAIVKALAADGLKIEAIHSALSPGNRNPRGASTVATILGYVGQPISTTVEGQSVDQFGWYDEEELTFPEAVRGRKVYTVDAPDLELFPKPEYFGARTVTFKAGLELGVMNQGMSLVAHLRRQKLLPNLTRQAKSLTNLSWLLYPLGSSTGAIVVSVEGEKEQQPVRRSLAIVAPDNGPLVAAAPAVLLTRRLLDGSLTERGAFPCVGLVSLAELRDLLEKFGFEIIQKDETEGVQ